MAERTVIPIRNGTSSIQTWQFDRRLGPFYVHLRWWSRTVKGMRGYAYGFRVHLAVGKTNVEIRRRSWYWKKES